MCCMLSMCTQEWVGGALTSICGLHSPPVYLLSDALIYYWSRKLTEGIATSRSVLYLSSEWLGCFWYTHPATFSSGSSAKTVRSSSCLFSFWRAVSGPVHGFILSTATDLNFLRCQLWASQCQRLQQGFLSCKPQTLLTVLSLCQCSSFSRWCLETDHQCQLQCQCWGLPFPRQLLLNWEDCPLLWEATGGTRHHPGQDVVSCHDLV